MTVINETSVKDVLTHIKVICSLFIASTDKVEKIEKFADSILNKKESRGNVNAKRKRCKG